MSSRSLPSFDTIFSAFPFEKITQDDSDSYVQKTGILFSTSVVLLLIFAADASTPLSVAAAFVSFFILVAKRVLQVLVA